MQATAGRILSVTDEEALSAQLTFARGEGIFCDPSAAVTQVAVSLAKCLDRNNNGRIETSKDVNGDGVIATDCNLTANPTISTA